MRRLHRLLHDSNQFFAQLAQIDLIAQGGTESGHYLGRIVLVPVEAAINDGLKTMAQESKESGDGQSGNHERNGIGLVEQPTQQGLQAEYQAKIASVQLDACGHWKETV